MGLYVPPDVDLPDAPMWIIRTPRMSREDVPDRMPSPGTASPASGRVQSSVWTRRTSTDRSAGWPGVPAGKLM